MVQVLSGHGCFGEYLYRVPKRERTTQCHHCEEVEDTAQHTLEHCPAWTEERRVLQDVLREVTGGDLSLPAVVSAMVGGERYWGAMASFCEAMISQKEAAERDRESALDADPSRRKRGGQRRRQYARLL